MYIPAIGRLSELPRAGALSLDRSLIPKTRQSLHHVPLCVTRRYERCGYRRALIAACQGMQDATPRIRLTSKKGPKLGMPTSPQEALLAV